MKFDHKDDFKIFNILNLPTNSNFLSTVTKQSKPKGISKVKYKGLMKLIPTIPQENKVFYYNLENLINNDNIERFFSTIFIYCINYVFFPILKHNVYFCVFFNFIFFY